MDDEGIEEPIASAPVEDPPEAEPAADTDADASRKPSVVTWAVLGVLVIGAIGFALLREDVLLEDDFSTPEALRAWPDDGQTYIYADGEYRLTAATRGITYAFRELPREVDGLTIAIDMRADPAAVGLIDCVSEATVDDQAGRVEVEGSYSLLIDRSRGNFALLSGESVLDEGSMPTDAERISFTCIGASDSVMLRVDVSGDEPFEMTTKGSDITFSGIGVGAYSESPGNFVAFDDLLVTGTDGKDS